MRIVQVETIRPLLQPNVCLVRLTDGDGRTGLGESFYGASVVARQLHDVLAGELLGAELDHARFADEHSPYVGYFPGSVEQRALGAVDQALWDLHGQATGQPLHALLGETARTELPTYNTCAGPGYVRRSTSQNESNWGTPGTTAASTDDDLEDLQAFLERPGHLARSLAAEGITAMKVWPFDRAAEANGGAHITAAQLDMGLACVQEIRDAVPAMAVAVELHGLWQAAPAAEICRAVAELRPMWIEDAVRPDDLDALRRVRAASDAPLATGETATGVTTLGPALRERLIDVATIDVGWGGGIGQARRVAHLAGEHGIDIAPHDCTGPVGLAVAVQLTASLPNGRIQETVRAFLRTWYPALVEGLPHATGDRIEVPRRPGHGVRLSEAYAALPPGAGELAHV